MPRAGSMLTQVTTVKMWDLAKMKPMEAFIPYIRSFDSNILKKECQAISKHEEGSDKTIPALYKGAPLSVEE